MFATQGAKVLDGTPHYFVIEELGDVSSVEHFKTILCDVKKYVHEKGIPSVSIVLNEKEALQTEYPSVLRSFGYQKQGTQFFYKRNLSALKEYEGNRLIEIESLEQATPDLFKKLWREASSGSLNASNASSSLSIEREFEGMKSEIGPDYVKSCLIVRYNKIPIGVTMPHIEPGTFDEGHLFYFGIIPSYRNQGWGKALHNLSLQLLKYMGAAYYIGATGHKNIPMQRILQANGCQLYESRYTYRLN